MAQAFHVEMIKPSHYDDDGYVIQWWKASIPSNSLASLYAIVRDAAGRQVLGDDVVLTLDGWDECNTIISEDRIAQRIAGAGAGLFSSWASRATSFPAPWIWPARFAPRHLKVVIGGFHVSGCLSMLDGPAPRPAGGDGPGHHALRR